MGHSRYGLQAGKSLCVTSVIVLYITYTSIKGYSRNRGVRPLSISEVERDVHGGHPPSFPFEDLELKIENI